MNEEIKEILDNVKKCCDIMKDNNFVVYQKQDILKLLDYITNLQQENDDLKNRLENAVADCYLRLQENEQVMTQLNTYKQENEGLEAENETLRSDFKNQVEYTNKIAEEKEDYKSRCEKAYEELLKYELQNTKLQEELVRLRVTSGKSVY